MKIKSGGNLKIRFATNERPQSSQPPKDLNDLKAGPAMKLKGFNPNPAAKNFMIKPANINAGAFNSGGGIKPKPISLNIPKMSESEYNTKREDIINTYSVRLIEVEDLKNHYSTSSNKFD